MESKICSTFQTEYHGYILFESRYIKKHVLPWILLELKNCRKSVTTLQFDNSTGRVNFVSSDRKPVSHHAKYIVLVNNLPQEFANLFAYLKLNGPLGISPYELHAFTFRSDVQVADIQYRLNEYLIKDRKSGTIMDSLRRSKQTAEPIHTLLKSNHSITEALFVFRVVMPQRNIESSGLDDLLTKYFQMPSPGYTRGRTRTSSVGDSSIPAVGNEPRFRRFSGSSSSSSTNNSLSDSQAFTSLSSEHQSPNIEQGNFPSSGPTFNHNSSKNKQRVMLLDIGPASVSLINPSDKKVIIEKFFLEVAHACKSTRFPEHLGIVFANDMENASEESFICYVFKTSNGNTTNELYTSLVRAMLSYADKNRLCDSCPINLVNTLAKDLYELLLMSDDMSEKQWKIEEVIRNCMLDLPSDILSEIESLMQSEKINCLGEKNVALFSTIRRIMEEKQLLHSDHQTKVLIKTPQSIGKIDILSRAKKTIASAFVFKAFSNQKKNEGDEPLRSRSYTEPQPPPPQKTIIQSLSQTDSNGQITSSGTRRRSLTLPDIAPLPSSEKAKLPEEDLLTPTQNNVRVSIVVPESHSKSSRRQTEFVSKKFIPTSRQRVHSVPTNKSFRGRGSIDFLATRRKSTRAKIFKSVVSSSRRSTAYFAKEGISDVLENIADECSAPRIRSSSELRAIWQRVTKEIIYLIKTTRHKTVFCQPDQLQDSDRVFKISGYLTYGNVPHSVYNQWEALLNSSDSSAKLSREVIHGLIKEGVPSSLRGHIWKYIVEHQPFLMHSHKRRMSMREKNEYESLDEVMNENFQDLLQQLTCHQHAILIDVGRTFPQHAYFSLGSSGQMSLYNVLKAYSLVDAEVGYCQGLTFVAGVVLLHASEEECFYLFSQFMYKLGLRKLYTPDMHYLESCMYQWSRLLLDRLPKVHSVLEEFDVMPSLYAPPWFLTFFSTQYPIWFVVRVFDLLFLVGIEAIYRVALKLVESKQADLEDVDCLEDVSDILKTDLPAMSHEQLSACISQAFDMDISSDLMIYSAEYDILQEFDQEEALNNNLINRFQEVNRELMMDNQEIQEELNASTAVVRSQENELAHLRSKYDSSSLELENMQSRQKELVALIEDMMHDIHEEKRAGYKTLLLKCLS